MTGDIDVGGIVACIAVMAVPITAILTAHQRKMAMIIHNTQQRFAQEDGQQQQLASEIRELKQMVYQQAIALDSLTNEVKKSNQQTAASDSLASRLGQDRAAS